MCSLSCILVLFVVLPCMHLLFTDITAVHTFFYFINYFLVLAVCNLFLPQQIFSMRLESLSCVHKPAFSSAIFPHFVLYLFACLFICSYFFQLLFSNTCENVSNRVGWPHDFHDLFTNPMWCSDNVCLHWSVLLLLCFHIFQFPWKIGYFFAWWLLLHCICYHLSHMKQ